jgi:hypothetical protein
VEAHHDVTGVQGGGDGAGDTGAACPPVPLIGVVVAAVESVGVGGAVCVCGLYGTLGQPGASGRGGWSSRPPQGVGGECG